MDGSPKAPKVPIPDARSVIFRYHGPPDLQQTQFRTTSLPEVLVHPIFEDSSVGDATEAVEAWWFWQRRCGVEKTMSRFKCHFELAQRRTP